MLRYDALHSYDRATHRTITTIPSELVERIHLA